MGLPSELFAIGTGDGPRPPGTRTATRLSIWTAAGVGIEVACAESQNRSCNDDREERPHRPQGWALVAVGRVDDASHEGRMGSGPVEQNRRYLIRAIR
jgi:hypothetical protein